MILRCTRKLLVVIGSPVADPAPARDPEDWYANLLWFDRRKCLLLTHVATLFTIFEADVTASSLRPTHQLVTGLIGRELRREDLPALRSVTLSSRRSFWPRQLTAVSWDA